MDNTHSVGPLYLTTYRYRPGERHRVKLAWTKEAEPPFRQGRGIVVPLGKRLSLGCVYGLWGHPRGESQDESLQRFLGASEHLVGPSEIGDWELEDA